MSKEQFNRRDMLFMMGLGAGAFGVLYTFGNLLFDWGYEVRSEFGKHSLNEFNSLPSDCEPSVHQSRVWVVVHPLYEQINGIVDSDNQEYKQYIQNLTNLENVLRMHSDELVINWDDREQFKIGKYVQTPPTICARNVVTYRGDGAPVSYVEMADGFESQRVDKLIGGLHQQGVTEAWFVGTEGPRCVTTAAEYFVLQGIQVRGVMGCIYPITPPSVFVRDIARQLYTNKVNPNQIFGEHIVG